MFFKHNKNKFYYMKITFVVKTEPQVDQEHYLVCFVSSLNQIILYWPLFAFAELLI